MDESGLLIRDIYSPDAGPAPARRTDPESSFRAADQARKRGAVGRQAEIVLGLVKAWSQLTSAELALKTVELSRHQIARTLPYLRGKGLVSSHAGKICGVTGRFSIYWMVTEKGIRRCRN